MEFTGDHECIVFEDNELLPALPSRGRLGVAARIMILCACLIGAAAVFFVAFGGLERLGDSLGFGGSGNGGHAPPSHGWESESGVYESGGKEENTETEDDVEDDVDYESSSGADTECDPSERVTEVDLSFSKEGDGYFLNYSKYVPDVEGLLEMGFGGGRSYYSEQPVVLILHTYVGEGYYDLDPNVPSHTISKSVVAVGDSVAYELNRRGVPTVHSTVIHGEDGKGAYDDAAETIRHMLEIYPTIEYVIDLRRMDERGDDGSILRTCSALDTAQIRLTVSSKGAGDLDTLSLALAMRRELNRGGSLLCMPVVYTDTPLNAGITPYYVRVDVGSSGNVTGEALAAGEYFAEALADILKK